MTKDVTVFVYNGESFTKGELANAYSVPYQVFSRWIKDICEENGWKISKEQYLPPAIIKKLLKDRGEPNWGCIQRVRNMIKKSED